MSYDNPQSRLYRSNGLVAGVCAGLGERFGIDPIFVRIVLILSVLCAGVGVFAYLMYWAVVPHKDSIVLEPFAASDVSRPFRRTRDRKIAGVCGGLARAWNVDPSLVRFGGLVAFSMSCGLLLLAYMIAIVVMPSGVPGVATERAVAVP